MDEDQNSEEPEVTPQDQESMIVEQVATEETPESAPEEMEESQEDRQERNWREMRKKQRELEERTKMQDEFIKNLMLAQQQQQVQAQQPQAPVEEEITYDPDEYPTYEAAERIIEKRAAKIAENKYLEMERKREQERFMERLATRYSDFNEVVNSETIKQFEKQEPELAETIADLKDPYKMGVQTYKFIKAMNLQDSAAEERHAKETTKKIEKNEKKVQTPQAYNKRPMAQAFSMVDMSDEEKKSLWEETQRYARQAGGNI